MKPTFELSEDVRKLVEFLEPREHASYPEMNRRVGRNLNGAERYVLTSARRVLERDSGKVFVTERGIGIRRATNGQVARLSTDHVVNKTRRVVRQGKKRDALVNVQSLDADDRDAYYIGRAVRQMLDATVGRKMRSKIAQEIQDRGGEPIDLTETIGLFQRKRR